MRTVTILTLGSLLLTACGAGTTPSPAGPDAAGETNLTTQSYTSTWAGGRCTFRQTYSDGSSHYSVQHNNGGYVRLHVKLLFWNSWQKVEQRNSASISNVYAAEVYAWCKVDGVWVGGFKYRTD